jgi:integrase
MPRKKGIPTYTCHAATGQARVRIDGRDHYLGTYGSEESKAEYDRLVRKHLADRTKAEIEADVQLHPDVTIAECLVRYYVHVEVYYRKDGAPTSQVLLIKRALRVLRERFGSLEAREYGPKGLRSTRDEYVKLGWCRAEVNRATRLIVQFFKWGVNEELIPEATWQALKAVPELRKGRSEAPEREPVGPVPEDCVAKVLRFLSPTVRAMVELQAATGMRPAEVVRMRACDLVMSGPVWEYRPRHKLEHLGKTRIVMIGPRAQSIIKEQLVADTQAYLFSPQRSEAERNAQRRAERATPLYQSHAQHQAQKKASRPRKVLGQRYTPSAYRLAVYRACDRAGVPRFSPNRLRHLVATRLRRELGLEAARVTLGHGDADTTTLYAERDLEQARAAMLRFG